MRMPNNIPLEALDLSRILRSGNAIVVANGCGEALSVLEKLVAQRHGFSALRMFLGAGFFLRIAARACRRHPLLRYRCDGSSEGARKGRGIASRPSALVGNRAVDTKRRDPLHGRDHSNSAPNADGVYSWGLTSDYLRAAVETARVVIAEVNDSLPWTMSDNPPRESEFDFVVRTSRPPLEVPASPITAIDRRIAEHITLQAGIGAIPESLMQLMVDHRDLGIHSGMLGYNAATLMEKGAVTNSYKEVSPGVPLTSALIGTKRLYEFAGNNPAIICSSEITLGASVLSKLKRFVSINSALEVDLTGQVNAECSANEYVGGVGGQVDYMRASRPVRAWLCCPGPASHNQKWQTRRIVAQLSGPVTTARSVTEHGVADLRGKSLSERPTAALAIAADQFRHELKHAIHMAGE